jgi:hypothetical protein
MSIETGVIKRNEDTTVDGRRNKARIAVNRKVYVFGGEDMKAHRGTTDAQLYSGS